ncbi:hypothetical protein OG738_36090 [Amycolatopsis sp. NBC_01488]|nr:hypothetical protein [Amycolatopsis sp. NBC_01488]
MPVHAYASSVEQDRAVIAVANGSADCPSDRRRQGHRHDLAALADHAQYPVSVFLTDVADVRAAGLEHAEAE